MKPRVLFVDHAGVLGGAELYLLDVARHYCSTSRVVLFEAGPFRDRLVEEAIDVRVLKAPAALLEVAREGGLAQSLKAFPGMAKLVVDVARMAWSFDLIYANSQKALIVGALAGLLARRPVIWNLHDILTADHFSSFNRRVCVFFANHLVDRVIVNSRATQQAFADSGGRVEKTHVVYNGIEASAFANGATADRIALRQELGVDDEPLVGVFSRLAPWKGQHVLLEALEHLPQVHAVLVGDSLFGPDEGYASRLHEQVERRGLRDRVHFLGFRRDVPRLMQAVDVVVHTSTAPEPFGRVIVEGMLSKKPVVATRAGGALEIVNHGETGLLVPPGDAQALAEALRRVLTNPAEAGVFVHKGYNAARTHFSREAMLGKIDAQVVAATA